MLSCSWFADEERIGAKRKKKLQHFNNFFDGGGAGGGLGGFFGRSGGTVTLSGKSLKSGKEVQRLS